MEEMMARKRYTPEQIVMKLREAERLQGQGLSVAAICKRLKVTDVTFYRWREKYGGKSEDQASDLRDLRLENERLKRIVVEKELEITVLKDVASGKL
jgi:transposase